MVSARRMFAVYHKVADARCDVAVRASPPPSTLRRRLRSELFALEERAHERRLDAEDQHLLALDDDETRRRTLRLSNVASLRVLNVDHGLVACFGEVRGEVRSIDEIFGRA